MKLLAVFLVLATAGCATLEVADNVRPGSPRYFAGTRLDIAAITQDAKALQHFERYEMKAPAYPHADVVFSCAADIFLFPFALGYSVTEPLLDVR